MPKPKKKTPDAEFLDDGRVTRSLPVSTQDQFLDTVTHDMKAGLRALTELPIWVEDDLSEFDIQVPPTVQEHLDLMRQSARGMSTLLDGLVALSRAGQTPDPPHRCTVEQAARRAWAGLAEGHGVRLETHDAIDTIFLPEAAVQKIFEALLENTLHHHDLTKGHVTVKSQTSGNRVQIGIEDDGPGLEPSQYQHVCDALFTVRSREETGRAGLGLTIAKKLITKFGGTLELAEASGGRGLAVHFDLPVRERW